MKKTACLLLASLTLCVACSDNNAKSQQGAGQGGEANASAQAQPVNVVTVTPREVTLGKPLPGRVEAYSAAQIRPQVSGIIESVDFEQGSLVNKGQQLYQIDDAQYTAAHNRAKANLQTANADLELAQLQFDRVATLLSTNAVSQQEYDTAKNSVAQAKAAVALAQAEVDAAQINLDYTKVYAPISGYIGPSSVTQGALVNAQQSEALAVIRQFDPIYVDISQSADQLQQLQASLLSSRTAESARQDYKVQILTGNNDTVFPHTGRLFASDLAVDQATGTTRVRVLVDNPDTVLLPGMYVRARIQTPSAQQHIVIPQKAVSIAPDGSKSVWLVGKDNTTRQRSITTLGTYKNNWLVESGLQDGDTVIVEGTMMMRPGTRVTPQEMSSSKAERGNS